MFAGLLSLSLHAVVFFGFNEHVPAKKRRVVSDEPVIQMTMPDLEEDKVEPVEALGDVPPETPSIAVPTLADLPSLVPVDAFVQPLDFTPALPTSPDASHLMTVPTNIARGSAAVEKLGKIFNVADLDRQPQPIFRPSPVFPYEMKREYSEASVVAEFIITTKGAVVSPRAISAQNRRFEEAALLALEKWKFRPGYKAGRPVNTRTQITIYFRVTADN